ncbi:MAG TPA: hypothetical protein VJ912_01705 [Candidatus Nanoarchaeia archaeon]|nr:hypothetical protein [Candidatus Nanoarchaeia archaeon]
MVQGKPKKRCEGCGRLLRTKNLFKSKDTNNKLLCRRCKKKEVTNPFYIPPKDRKSKYTVDNIECKSLYKQYIKEGLSPEQAKKRLNKLKSRLKYTRNMYKRRKMLMKIKEKESEDQNIQLVKGLGMKNIK